MILSLERVSAFYGPSLALREVSIAVEQGAIAAVVGPNGAGKTTLLRAIAGLLRPSQGTIRYDGREINDLPVHTRAQRGLVLLPETRELFWGLSVRKNLMLATIAHKERDAAADLERVLEYFPRLKDRLNQRAGSMSGGEQQMLAVARAIVMQPRVLLLDEPSLGLSPILIKSLFALFANLRRDLGVTIVLAEQNTNMALEIADAVYGLNLGTIVASGTPDELRTRQDYHTLFLGV